MKGSTMFVAFVFASGCYASYADQCEGDECGRDDFPIVTCEVAVTANADGATVTVDGVATSGTVELETGFHTFAATAPGYFSVSQTVEVTRRCEPVELSLLPNLNGEYDLVLHNLIYDRLILHIVQEGTDLWAEDWYEDRPEYAWQLFIGTVSVNGEVEVDLLSEDSVRLHMEGRWTPPGIGGVSRIAGTWTSAAGGDGEWVAESRP